MADSYQVRINIGLLCERLSAAESREWSPDEVREWLRDNDFLPYDDGWVCEEISLAVLAPGEFEIVRIIA